MTKFEILDELKDVETIASGRGVYTSGIWSGHMAKDNGER